jgi:hypothetical protein
MTDNGGGCECYAVIIDDFGNRERHRFFLEVFPPSGHIPILPKRGIVSSTDESVFPSFSYWLIDKARLERWQLEEIAARLGGKAGYTTEQYLSHLQDPDFDLPLEDKGLAVSICEQHSSSSEAVIR